MAQFTLPVRLQNITGAKAAQALRGPEVQRLADVQRQLAGNIGTKHLDLYLDRLHAAAPSGSMRKGEIRRRLQESPLTLVSQDLRLSNYAPNKTKEFVPDLAEIFYDLVHENRAQGRHLLGNYMTEVYGLDYSDRDLSRLINAIGDEDYDAVYNIFPQESGATKWFVRGDEFNEMDDELLRGLLDNVGVDVDNLESGYPYRDIQRAVKDGPGYRVKTVYLPKGGRAPLDSLGKTTTPMVLGDRINLQQWPHSPSHFSDLSLPGLRGRELGHFRASMPPAGYHVEELQSDYAQLLSRLNQFGPPAPKVEVPMALRDPYSLLASAALNDAARSSAAGFYLPSASVINPLRGGKDFSPIYDRQILDDWLPWIADQLSVPVVNSRRKGFKGLHLPPDLRQQLIDDGIPYRQGGKV